MSTNTQPTSNDNLVTAIGYVFGGLHFVFQTAADLTAHAEGKLIENITKNDANPITYDMRVNYRKQKTVVLQQNALAKMEAWKAKMEAAKAARSNNVEPQTT